MDPLGGSSSTVSRSNWNLEMLVFVHFFSQKSILEDETESARQPVGSKGERKAP